MSRTGRDETVRRWTLCKAVVLALALTLTAAQTLALRQRRLDAASAMLRAHEATIEAQWAARSLEARIARYSAPARVAQLARGLVPLTDDASPLPAPTTAQPLQTAAVEPPDDALLGLDDEKGQR